MDDADREKTKNYFRKPVEGEDELYIGMRQLLRRELLAWELVGQMGLPIKNKVVYLAILAGDEIDEFLEAL